MNIKKYVYLFSVWVRNLVCQIEGRTQATGCAICFSLITTQYYVYLYTVIYNTCFDIVFSSSGGVLQTVGSAVPLLYYNL